MTDKNGTIAWRMTQMEKQVQKLDDKVNEIMVNHLPHLENEIVGLKGEVKINSIKIATIVGLITSILSAIINVVLTKFI